MLKGNLIHPRLSSVLAETGHTEMLAIVDAGFPISQSTERIDLAWIKGQPSWEDVCSVISEKMIIEKAYLAQEVKEKSPQVLETFKRIFPNVPIEFIPHSDFKALSKSAKATVRTGEYTSFSNCILVAGVAF